MINFTSLLFILCFGQKNETRNVFRGHRYFHFSTYVTKFLQVRTWANLNTSLLKWGHKGNNKYGVVFLGNCLDLLWTSIFLWPLNMALTFDLVHACIHYFLWWWRIYQIVQKSMHACLQQICSEQNLDISSVMTALTLHYIEQDFVWNYPMTMNIFIESLN